MRIALVNWDITGIGGSQAFTHTLADAFVSLGHSVTVHDTHFRGEADVVILSQPSLCTAATVSPVIQVSHSFFIPMEEFTDRSPYRVSISEEVRQANLQKGFDSVVINNPIDTVRFFTIKPRKECARVLYLSHDGGKAKQTIQKACFKAKVNFRYIEQKENDLSPFIRKSDLCIGIGRCLIEAMMMGKNVISGDHRSWMDSFTGAGVITKDNYDSLQPYNFSGRDNLIEITEDLIIQAIKNYDPERGIALSERVSKEYNARTIAKKYLRLVSNEV